ncbi:hypothetical protein C2G38_1528103 [Gigaspora rosea]|uniref:Uncharacterized protein n=1 Tax=Gigaspora rosea TaxID=44941 RepID=A0A397V5J9_9GLOM|nr:hypothetical protein C2G38_1528103 [Gigaspora rosea]
MEANYGKVMFVKLDQQPRGGIIQFEDPIALKVSSVILNDNLDFDGIKPVFTVLQDEEEKNYYLYKRNFIGEIRKKFKDKHTKRNNVQRKVEGKNDAEIADCSSTSVVGNKNKLDDTTEAEKSSASKPKPEEIVGNKHKHDTTEAEMSPKLEEAVVGNKRNMILLKLKCRQQSN